jgi:hypothetical protein
MIAWAVVFAEIRGRVEDDVNTPKCVSELGEVADVSYDDVSSGVAEFSPRFFFGPSQRPHLVAGLMKNADQIVS